MGHSGERFATVASDFWRLDRWGWDGSHEYGVAARGKGCSSMKPIAGREARGFGRTNEVAEACGGVEVTVGRGTVPLAIWAIAFVVSSWGRLLCRGCCVLRVR